MKHLLVYTENYDPGGGNRYLFDFVNSVPDNVEVVLASNKGAFLADDGDNFRRHHERIELGIRTKNLRMGSLLKFLGVVDSVWWRRIFESLYRLPFLRVLMLLEDDWFNQGVFSGLLRRRAFDAVIIFNGGFPAALSCFALVAEASRRGLNMALSVVSMPARKTFIDCVLRGAIRKVDRYIVNCYAIGKELVSSRRIPAGKIELLRNKVGQNIVVPSGYTEYSFPTRGMHLTFGFVGRVQKEKGVFDLLEAFASICQEFPGTKLKLFGKIYDRGHIESTIVRLGIGKSVGMSGYFEGPVNEVLRSIDIFVFPSLWEGFPFSILEAMAVGLPIIATRVGGIPEMITDGVNGLLVPRKNPRALFSAMRTLCLDPELRERMAAAALETIRSEYNARDFGENAQRILSHVLP